MTNQANFDSRQGEPNENSNSHFSLNRSIPQNSGEQAEFGNKLQTLDMNGTSFGGGAKERKIIRSNFQKSDSFTNSKGGKTSKRKVFSVSQILARVNQKKQRKFEQKKRKKPFKPIIPPKSFLLLFQEKPEKYVYNRRIIDYKHCGLLQRYIGLGGKILPRRQTKLTAKQQRYVAKTIKSARIMGLLPFVTKERGFFR